MVNFPVEIEWAYAPVNFKHTPSESCLNDPVSRVEDMRTLLSFKTPCRADSNFVLAGGRLSHLPRRVWLFIRHLIVWLSCGNLPCFGSGVQIGSPLKPNFIALKANDDSQNRFAQADGHITHQTQQTSWQNILAR
jgi:hypothetical protein